VAGLSAVEGWREAASGLRRFDPGRDLRGVIELLSLGFDTDLEARDRRWLADLNALSGAGPLLSVLLRVLPGMDAAFSGYVWYESGRLVGNVSVMRVNPEVALVANVVTHPDHRRRGIAHELMRAAVEGATTRGVRQVQLQVRDDNAAAQALYRQMGFRRLHAVTTLRLPSARVGRALAELGRADGAQPELAVAAWGRSGALRAQRLVARADGLDGPPGLVRQAIMGRSVAGALVARLRGERSYRWAVTAGGEYRGVAVAQAGVDGGPHGLELAADPRWRGRVERALVRAALAALARHAPAEVEAQLRASEQGALDALAAVGFEPVRTLDRMALDLASG
jgi:ribosomal protein S18 acetylase RimI-like enzyme